MTIYRILWILIIISIIFIPYALKYEIQKRKYKSELENWITKAWITKEVSIEEIKFLKTYFGKRNSDGNWESLWSIRYILKVKDSNNKSETFNESLDLETLITHERFTYSSQWKSLISEKFEDTERDKYIKSKRHNALALHKEQDSIWKFLVNKFLKIGDKLNIAYNSDNNKIYALINPVNIYLSK